MTDVTAMPSPRPPYLHRVRTRHGKVVWYVQRERGAGTKQTRLRAPFGTAEFWAEYQDALAGQTSAPAASKGPANGTLAWLIARYKETAAWSALSEATRRQRINIFEHVIANAGTAELRKITTGSIAKGRDKRAATPAQARNYLDAMRGLFRWAVQAQLAKIDPTIGVHNPPRVAGPGFVAWTEDDVRAYEKCWTAGTRERVWLHVLLYTGLRRGDAVRLGRQNIGLGTVNVDGKAKEVPFFQIRTEKSGGKVTATIPIHPALRATIDRGPTGDLSLICGKRGEPLTKESFGNMFSDACRAASIRKSAHGLRKLAATRVAEAGGTTAQLKAIFGWTDDAMPSLYTKNADRRRLALTAAGLIGGTAGEQTVLAPGRKVRTMGQKAQQNQRPGK